MVGAFSGLLSRKKDTIMKTCLHIQSRIAIAGLLFGLASTASTGAAVIHVPADYPTIQAAINAAGANDTIQIASGVYAGQVLISNKSLTLSGSPGTVLRAVPGMSQPYAAAGSSRVPLLGISRAQVVVSGLTLEGERLSDAQPGSLHGIFFDGAGGRVEDCRITGFRGSTLSSGGSPSGIIAFNLVQFGTGVVDIKVLNSSFADNRSSIAFIGDYLSPTLLRTTFSVNDNTITGNGPVTNGVQRGIMIEAGTGGEVVRNTITDHSYIGTTEIYPWAQGVLAVDMFHFGSGPLSALHPVRYEGNVFRNNQEHLLVLRGDGSAIVNNSFEGAGQGLRPFGIGISGLNPLIGTNRFRDLDTGILLLGDDPLFGTYLGVTTNAQVTANRFCNVTTNVVVQPLATDTEQGTLTCPFPLPPLAIAPAALLSWPDDGETHGLESAPDLQGPWSAMNATLTVQDGQVTVGVKTDRDHQFFRLR